LEILGKNSPLIRRIRRLRRSAALRLDEGVFLAEGPRLAREALRRGCDVELAVLAARLGETDDGRELAEQIGERGWDCRSAADSLHDSLQDARTPQPVLLLVRRRTYRIEHLTGGDSRRALLPVLWGVQDPGNLGSLLRTAEAAGATGCAICGASADPYHPRAVRASAGSVLDLPLVRCEIDELLEFLASRRVLGIGTVPDRGEEFRRCDLRRPVAVFLGGEGAGLPASLLERLDERISVPMTGSVASLSVAAAGAVVLYEAQRQRSAALSPTRPDSPGNDG